MMSILLLRGKTCEAGLPLTFNQAAFILQFRGTCGVCPGGAMVAQPTCNRQVSGFESPSGLM